MISTVLQGLRGQRKTAALMSAVLVIAFFFMTIASIILSSVQEAQQQERERIYGNFQLLFYGNSTAADRLAEQNPGSRISSIVGKTGSGQTVATITSSFQEYANLDIIQGRLPENEGEILLVGPDVWDHQPGDTVKISYTFHHVAPLQTGALIEVEEEIKQIKQQLVLNEIPNRLKPNMIAYWNNEVGNENHNEWVEAFLPEYMLKPYNQLSSEQKNQALVFVYEHGPFFENANRIDLGDFAAFDTKDALQYPKDQMTVNGMQVYLNLAGSSVTLVGGGFREYMGTVISQEPLLTDSRVDVTYTVCGIAQEYKDNWGTNGLSMPDAFVTPEGLDVVREVLDRVEEKYPYVLPQSKASLLLWQGGEDYDPFLRSYNDLYSASYRLMGQSTQVHSTRAFLLGIDPATGEEIAYNVIGDYVDIGDSRHYFLEGDLTDPDFRLEGLDPLPMEPVTEQMLYNNNTGILRINSHAYPPVGDATGTIQLLLQGVLIGMSVCSCFQIYLQSLKRRKQKLDTLIAIGATDGQLVTILLMEVVLLLAASCILGAGLGCLGGLIVLKSILEIPMVWDFTSILPAYGLMSGAVLLGVLLPILKILREQLQKHRKKVRPVRVYRSRGSGYRSIRLRHNRVNRRQTLLRNVIILFLCAILLLPVFLIHRSFDSYRQNVTYADRPEYELQLPYGAAMRHLNEITEEIDVPLEKLRSYVTAENVYLHCDDFLSESPILKTLASDSRGSALFRKLDNRDTGFPIRMVTTAWDS